jgi:hypothetical protein
MQSAMAAVVVRERCQSHRPRFGNGNVAMSGVSTIRAAVNASGSSTAAIGYYLGHWLSATAPRWFNANSQ